MRVVTVGAGYMEMVLGQGLTVLCGLSDILEGELFRIDEVSDKASTGRSFFARAMHVPEPGIIQITLQPYMEQINEETGKPERFPMAGDFANEKYTMPPGEWEDWAQAVKGEKPLWIYRGVKWVQEMTISKFFFADKNRVEFEQHAATPPVSLHLNIQGPGGEKIYSYALAGQVVA